MSIQILDDPAFVYTGDWGTGGTGGYRTSYHFAGGGVGFGAATAAGTVRVTPGVSVDTWATWVPDTNRGAAVTYEVRDGDATGAVLASVVMDQRSAPSGLTADGVDWEPLATVTPTNDTLTVVLVNTGTGDTSPWAVIADAFRFDPAFPPPIRYLDDDDSNTIITGGGWTHDTSHGGFGGGDHRIASSLYTAATYVATNSITWTGSVVIGSPTRVSATWKSGAGATAGAVYRVYDGAVDPANLVATLARDHPGVAATAVFDQLSDPASFTENTTNWADLAVYTPTDETLNVVLDNSPAVTDDLGAIIADAIRVSDVDFPASYVLEAVFSPTTLRPTHAATMTLGWALHYPDPSGMDFTFATTAGTITPSGHLGGTATATLDITLTVPFGTPAGTYHVTATPAVGTPIVFPFVVPAYTARIRPGSLKVSPDGNVLMVLVERISDGADTGVTTVTGGVISWDGGGSITLGRPMFMSYLTFAWWALNENHRDRIDDADATTTGVNWLTQGPNGVNGGFWDGTGKKIAYDDARQKLPAGNPSDTITYTFTGVIPGTYAIRTSIIDFDATFAPGATYKVYDGAVDPGNLVATIVDDQTASRDGLLDFEAVWDRYRFRRVGVATVAGTTLTVVVSNPSGARDLIADCVEIERLQTDDARAVPVGATNLRLNAPDAWVVTSEAGGALAPAVDTPVTYMPTSLASPDAAAECDWAGYDPANPKTMKVGYNKAWQNNGEQCLGEANLVLGGVDFYTILQWRGVTTGVWAGLPGSTASPICDIDGNMTGFSGTGLIYQAITSAAGEATDTLNYNSIPPSGTVRILYNTPDAGHVPTVMELYDYGQSGVTFTALTGPVIDPHGSGKQCVTQRYERIPCTSPNAPGGAPALAIKTNGCAADIRFTIDEVTPPDWPHVTHPTLYSRLHGFGYVLRAVQAIDTYNATNVSDIPRHSRTNYAIPSSTPLANIISVHPIVEADDAARYFSPVMKAAVIRIHVDSTAGFGSGTLVAINPSADNFDDTGSGPGQIVINFAYNILVTIGPQDFLLWCHSTSALTSSDPTLCTLAASHTITGTITVPAGFGNSFQDLWTRSNENLSAPWLNIPHGATNAWAEAAGAEFGANLDSTLDMVLEYTNEWWNGASSSTILDTINTWMLSLVYQYGHAYAGDSSLPDPTDPAHAYIQRGSELMDAFESGFVGAGGDPSKIKRFAGACNANPGGTTAKYVNYILSEYTDHGRILKYHYMGGDGYQENEPFLANYPQAYADAVYDDLDASGLVSIWAINNRWGGRSSNTALHAGHLSRLSAIPGYPDIKLCMYEWSLQNACPRGSDGIARGAMMLRHFRMYFTELGVMQEYQRTGFGLSVKFDMDQSAGGPGNGWGAYSNALGGPGTGDPTENPNPFAIDTVSQVGGAIQTWAAGVTTPTESVPIPIFMASYRRRRAG